MRLASCRPSTESLSGGPGHPPREGLWVPSSFLALQSPEELPGGLAGSMGGSGSGDTRADWQSQTQTGVLWDGEGSGLPSQPSSPSFVLTGCRGYTYHPKAPQG